MRASTVCVVGAVLGACGDPAPPADVVDAVVPSADGVPIQYDARGSGDPALVLVHGWTNSRGIWGEHLHTLSDKYRVVALDLAGHGSSGAERGEWTMGAFGDDVKAVVDALDLQRVVLVGFSMGGVVVLEAAQRLGDRVAGIVFVDTFHDVAPVRPLEEFERTMRMFRATWRDTAFLRAFAYTPDAPDSLILQTRAHMPATPRERWFDIARAMRAWNEKERSAVLQRLAVPVAAINTIRQPTNVATLRRYFPGFTVDTMHGVGHAGILRQRVADFDARLDAIVQRFVSERAR